MSTENVACPKCKGGCDLCSGTGRVPQGVARVYSREEARQTTKMPAHLLDRMREPWPSEVPTTPATIARAALIRRIVFWALLVTAALIVGVLITVLLTVR